MERVLVYLVLFVSFYNTEVDSARILGVFPVPSISHQVVFRALTLELVKRGHEVVVLTTDPAFKGKESPENLSEIDISELYPFMLSKLQAQDIQHFVKRGVILEWTSIWPIFVKLQLNVMERFFEIPEVNNLIEDKNKKFDLVIIEGLTYVPLIFSKIFNAPAVLFSSLYGTTVNFEVIGGLSRHPIQHPNFFRSNYKSLSVLDKIQILYDEYKLWNYERTQESMENDLLKRKFGVDSPTTTDLKKHVVLLLTNSHPIFDGNRPVPPGVINLGALHIEAVKPLPEDLKSYLDNSSRGVVYVSLGTNVRPSEMDKDFLDAFLDAFEALPYNILWKFDGESLGKIPKNVRIQKWFPQRDLLAHPNIKAYVMQGGLQSTDEAIDSEIPLVGIPMLGDQWFNTNKYVELGIGLSLDSFTLKATDIINAVNHVVNDPRFKDNIRKLKAIMQDQPQKPIERAAWWVEHVLRHKGSRHLIGPAADMAWSEYLMLDVVVVLVSSFTILLTILLWLCMKIVKQVMNSHTGGKVKEQ